MPEEPNAITLPAFDVSEGVALITLNRPKKLNAIDYGTIDALIRMLDLFEIEDHVRVVIITGAGDAFCAGADIADFAASVKAGVDVALREFVRRGQALTRRIESYPKPIIAAVNGIAYGGGCEVIEACALAIASSQARFAKPEIKLGFPPPFGGTQRLPRLIGRRRALKLILTGDAISADEALEIGLINEVVPPAQLLPRCRELAQQLANRPAVAVSACLAAVTRGINLTIDEGLAVEASQFARAAGTTDIQEGIEAFLEKRPPQFTGR
jgi:enoyl-CoA hydratase/carnithine racemase